jgi:hypothetical protein
MGGSDRTRAAMSTVGGWLDALGLKQYIPPFAENIVGIDSAVPLTEALSKRCESRLATASRQDSTLLLFLWRLRL